MGNIEIFKVVIGKRLGHHTMPGVGRGPPPPPAFWESVTLGHGLETRGAGDGSRCCVGEQSPRLRDPRPPLGEGLLRPRRGWACRTVLPLPTPETVQTRPNDPVHCNWATESIHSDLKTWYALLLFFSGRSNGKKNDLGAFPGYH